MISTKILYLQKTEDVIKNESYSQGSVRFLLPKGRTVLRFQLQAKFSSTFTVIFDAANQVDILLQSKWTYIMSHNLCAIILGQHSFWFSWPNYALRSAFSLLLEEFWIGIARNCAWHDKEPRKPRRASSCHQKITLTHRCEWTWVDFLSIYRI